MPRYQSFHISHAQPGDARLTLQSALMIGKMLTKRTDYLQREAHARNRLSNLPPGRISVDACELDRVAMDMAQRAHGIHQALELAYRTIFEDDYAPMVGMQVSDLAPLAKE
jgi:hypothetical protein